jgi:hypothetical protein
MKTWFGSLPEMAQITGEIVEKADGGLAVARHLEKAEGAFSSGCALILEQLYSAAPGEGRMTRFLGRYLRRLPAAITEVWVQAHPYRCEDALHWTEVVRFARWLRRCGFRFQDRQAFFARLRELLKPGDDGFIRFRAVADESWMVLER